jgi:hypothetical protein
VFGESAIFDTSWGGWVWWAGHALASHDTVTEYWGAGRFLGVYPTKQRIGIVACAPSRTWTPMTALGGANASCVTSRTRRQGGGDPALIAGRRG